MYWLGEGPRFLLLFFYYVYVDWTVLVKQKISALMNLKKKRKRKRKEMQGSCRKEWERGRDPLCSLFLKAGFSQPADFVTTFMLGLKSQFQLICVAMSDVCEGCLWEQLAGCSQGTHLATGRCWVGGKAVQRAGERPAV